MKGRAAPVEVIEDPRGFDPDLEAALGSYEPKWRKYSVEDEEKIRRYWGKVHPALIAKKLGRTEQGIIEKADRMGLVGGAP